MRKVTFQQRTKGVWPRQTCEGNRSTYLSKSVSAVSSAVRSRSPVRSESSRGAIARRGLRFRGTKTISGRPVAMRMDYPPRVRAVLDRAKADQGDTVLVVAKGERYEGTLMPHHGFSGEDI